MTRGFYRGSGPIVVRESTAREGFGVRGPGYEAKQGAGVGKEKLARTVFFDRPIMPS
jgi:hypothetical protein